ETSAGHFSVSGTHTYSATGSDTAVVTLSDSPGSASATADTTINVVPPAGQTFTFTTGTDNFHGGAGNDTFIAKSGTLTSGDVADGGGGTNTLELQGAGSFNLATPTTLTNIQVITAQEGQSAGSANGQIFAAQNQIITLRAGLNATINVSAATLNPANPKPATITIIGAQNNDVINLATGNDSVTLGGVGETVNGGGGNNIFTVSSSTIGATINGGTGTNTLQVTGGGTMAMGSNITGIATVQLTPGTTAYNFTANAISGLTVNDLGTGLDTITAGGGNQTLTGGAAGKETMVGSASGSDTFKDATALLNGDTIKNFAAPDDAIDLTDLNSTLVGTPQFVQSSGTSGVLTVTDGTHTAAITLFGQFVASGFHTQTDGGTGTLVTYQPPQQPLALAAPHA
ncbi:MAG TPA: hypothetical protein VMU42_04680, partial [Candidatus Sulfotelmatobacter sp.]|nr:hypothetical protein [Candidatus Sulfotelmatobacter sp.]